MSSNLFAITISLKPSKKAIALFSSIYLFAVFAVLLSEMPFNNWLMNLSIKISLIAVIIWNAYHVFTKYVLLLHKRAVIGIECKNTEWRLFYKSNNSELNHVENVELLQIKALSTQLILLRFNQSEKVKGKKFFAATRESPDVGAKNLSPTSITTLFLWSDNTTSESFHQLLLLSKIIF